MRIVGVLAHENEARRFSTYLQAQDVLNEVEMAFDPATGQMSYQIWIRDEDRLTQAAQELEAFRQDPSNEKFNAPEPQPQEVEPTEEPLEPRSFGSYFTLFMVGVCAFCFFLNFIQMIPIPSGTEEMTPIQEELMFDLPPLQGPYWEGMYTWVVHKIEKIDSNKGEGPLFVEIRHGEVWRLFTPAILHIDLLHILFNMLWLWYLGRAIEQRIGPWRSLVFTLTTGVGANVAQYLMSGPFFLGYSGIIMAMAGFIWMRQRKAPWEGYPISRGTLLFLLLFVIAIFGLQIVAFGLQIFTHYHFNPSIANTAHITGALLGVWLGRLSYFAKRVHS